MQPDASNSRQQIVERIKQSTNVLVAVSTDPTVDELSAALGLALMLNKMDKHATAIFSGKMPPAMDFLDASKTFENTVDSLRDFIISLDKAKADRLRYKVENDAVRIFITPYKTTITEKDLQFSQGDFNVELIIALGVIKRDELDKAIVAHGRILHDATVVTINAEAQKSSLGVIDWHDADASSLCEMLVGMSESFQQPGLVDAQISTALLTGIVAATDRFSNQKTNPKIMTMAAQLMAAGANQQLIATNLGKASELSSSIADLVSPEASVKLAEDAPKKDGELDIEHTDEPAEKPAPKKVVLKPVAEPEAPKNAEAELEAALPNLAPSGPVFDKLKAELTEAEKAEEPKVTPFLQPPSNTEPGSKAVDMTAPEAEEGEEPKADEPFLASHSSWREKRLEPPEMGGTLSATSEQALGEEQKANQDEHNKVILSHDGASAPVVAAADVPAPEPVVTPMPEPAALPAEEPVAEPAPAVDETVLPPLPMSEPPAPTDPGETPNMPSLPVFEPGSEPAPIAPPPALAPPSAEPAAESVVEPVAPPPAVEPVEAPAPEPAAIEPPAPAPEPVVEAPVDTPPVVEPAPAPDLLPEPPITDVTAPAPDLDAARQAVNDALGSVPFNPANQPRANAGTAPLGGPLNTPAVPDMPTAPSPVPNMPAAPSPVPTDENLPPLPPMPPLPPIDFNQPLPPPPPPPLDAPAAEPTAEVPATPSIMPELPTPPLAPPVEPPVTPTNDPGQFKIPGQ